MRSTFRFLLIGGLAAVVVAAQGYDATDFERLARKLAHVVAFGAIALLLMAPRRRTPERVGDRPLGAVWAWVIAVSLGLLSQAGQLLMHRTPSGGDILRDALGAFIAVLASSALAGRSGHGRALRALQLVVAGAAAAAIFWPMAVCLAAYAHRDLLFPVVAEFHEPIDLYFLGRTTSDVALTTPSTRWLAAPDEMVLSVPLLAERFDGVALREPYPDWRGYSTLLVDLTNPTLANVHLTIRIHDRAHNQDFDDRFNREILLPAGTRTVTRLALREIELGPRTRRMDLRQLAGISIFRNSGTGPQSFQLNRIWLE